MAYKYEVFVDDNFHYMDKDERYKLGDFENLESAIEACKNVVDQDLWDLDRQAKARGDEGQLYEDYVSFGTDPFILTNDPKAGAVPFSAWDYAKEQCEKQKSITAEVTLLPTWKSNPEEQPEKKAGRKLLFIGRPLPEETVEEFVERIFKSLKDRGLADEQGKLVIPKEPNQ